MNNNNTYNKRKRERLLEKPKSRYPHKGGKKQAKEYYQNHKKRFKEQDIKKI